MPVAFEGFLLAPDGAPAEGARVVSSAGGNAVTVGGHYRFEARVPFAAERVRITAFGCQGTDLFATLSVSVSPGARAVRVGPLRLARGANCQSSWIPTFGAEPGVSGSVHAMVVFDDGQGQALYVGGSFPSAGGVLASNVVRWDGTSWSPLGSGVGGSGYGSSVHALTVFDDGSGAALYAGGSFTTAGGAAANCVARWDGTNWSALGDGTDELVWALTSFDDGSGAALYAGGSFLNAGGAAASRVARWDGTSWSPLGNGMNNHVMALTTFDDGSGLRLYAGGQFTTAGGAAASRVARWDGTSWSALGAGTNGLIWSLETFDDGGGLALYAGGTLTTAGGLAASRVARWDGASWSPLGSGVSSTVNDLEVFDDGSGLALYVGGAFETAGGAPASGMARWDGSSWSAVGSGLSGEVNELAIFDDGSGPALWVGSDLGALDVGGQWLSMAKWEGSSWSHPSGGLNGSVQDLLVFDEGSGPAFFVAGGFSGHGSVVSPGILRWDGANWTDVGGGMNSSVLALCVFDDGSGPALYAAGWFTSAGGIGANRIAKWDGTSWSPLGSGLSGILGYPATFAASLEVFDDGGGPALYVGGAFRTAGGVTVNGIARWDGAAWSALGTGLTYLGDPTIAEALATFDDGGGQALYVGGRFYGAGGVSADDLVKWNGSSWSAVGGPDGPGDNVFALEVADLGDGAKLYVGGSFTDFLGVGDRLVTWDGTSFSEVGGGTDGAVEAFTFFDDGDGPALYVGGSFTSVGGTAASGVAKWNGTSWSALGGGLGGVSTLAVFDDGDGEALYAGGGFHRANDSGDSFLAKWWCPDTAPPVLECPSDILVGDRQASPPGEVVTFAVTATDHRDPTPTLVCTPPSGSHFPRGRTRVTCIATDAQGNSSTCQFTVTVAQGLR